jgi:enhancer of mRNA-decapping protein 4
MCLHLHKFSSNNLHSCSQPFPIHQNNNNNNNNYPYDHYQNNFPIHHRSISFPTPPSNPNDGARLMALLSAPPPTQQQQRQPVNSPLPLATPSAAAVTAANAVAAALIWLPSSKVPKGRHLIGDHVVCDVGVRLPREFQPQLEVAPITKYGSDPNPVLGR